MNDLGESASTDGEQLTSAKAGLEAYRRILVNERNHAKEIIKGAKAMSLNAAKIQESQHLAADESSRIEVDSHVLSQRLASNNGRIAKLQSSKSPRAQDLKIEMKRLAIQDHQQYNDLSKLNAVAGNAVSNEDAGVEETKVEVNSGDEVMDNLAADLMPAA